MALQQLSSPPESGDYTPLAEHQAQTPSTFFGGNAVLHAQYSGLTLLAAADNLQEHDVLAKFATTPGEQPGDVFVEDVDFWVSSKDLIIFQTKPTPFGVSITYPAIGLHATMKYKSTVPALYMNVSLNDAETVNNEEDILTLELTILPPKYASSDPETACISEIFNAMNACADLHPDPNNSDAEDEPDETMPGATGWITADNVDQYLDEDGNFHGTVIGGEEELGPGAGTVRARDDLNGVNGVNGDDHENKYHRIE
ncbi:regulator of volume decrease after cellular swelling-domain-containing protein [Massariosphaeria phaeospora]|uniref:Regulator of volume decrease after cellular swelling-domain-containing protein n=1 Tax=Massariosphaeria phaeospora TaxID=100035 RepID=A0A7C8I5A0_9PLEO|nr:regulator of volume decrease after cellular swelling-domain-containing protein [Massariosphaeria phaeospora]